MSVGKINDLVSEQALKQLDDLYAKLGIARNEMVSATEQAAKFNAALGDSTSIENFNKASATAAASIQNVVAANTALTQSQKEVVVQTQAITDAVKIRVAADANADQVLRQVGGTLDQNIKLLIQQKLELKNVTDQLKTQSKAVGDSYQAQSKIINQTQDLTKRQLELKEAIAAQSLAIKQQVKDNNAAGGSQDQLLAKLNQLRKAYNSLSEEERNNAQIGGVLLANIKQLSTATTQINQEQGKYNDNVGNYTDKIKAAISAYVPYGNQLVRGIDTLKNVSSAQGETTSTLAKLGFGFAGFTIAGFAVAISAATYYLGLFQDTSNKVDITIAGLKGRFADFGKTVVEAFDKLDNTKPSERSGLQRLASFLQAPVKLLDRIDPGNKAASDNAKSIEKLRIEYEKYNDVVTQNIARLDAQANLERATSKDKLIGPDARREALARANKAEEEALKLATEKTNSRIALAVREAQQYNTTLKPEQIKRLQGGDIQFASDLALKGSKGGISTQAYEDLKAGYAEQTALVGREALRKQRLQSESDNILLKQQKQINTDELELQKARLQDEQKTAKLILDDNKQSYDARLAALAIYVKRSNDLIDNELKIADAAPQITGTQKKTNAVKAGSAKKDVTSFDNSERLKIQKEAIKEFEDLYKSEYQQTLDDLQDNLNAQVLAIGNAEAVKAQVLNDAYLKGSINQKQYQDNLKLINDKANADKIQAEIDTQEAIIGVQASLQAASAFTGLNIGGVSARAVQGSQNKLTGLKTQQIQNGIKSGNDSTSNDRAEQIKKAQDIGKAINDVQQLQNFGESLLTAEYQKQIELLEQKKQAITDNAKQETEAVNNSIASEKTKQSQINVINKQAEQQQRQVDEQEKRIKKQQAVAQKAFNIASIIENTAVGVSLALAQGGLLFGVPFAAIVGALGAVQLATVLAQPLPQFEKGGTVAKDGKIITGEAGTELRIDPSGSLSLTAPYANVTHAKAGTKIISNKELMAMVGKPEQVMYVGGQSVDMKQVESLLKENNELQKQNKAQRPRVNVNLNDDWGFYKQQYFR